MHVWKVAYAYTRDSCTVYSVDCENTCASAMRKFLRHVGADPRLTVFQYAAIPERHVHENHALELLWCIHFPQQRGYHEAYKSIHLDQALANTHPVSNIDGVALLGMNTNQDLFICMCSHAMMVLIPNRAEHCA